MSEQEKALVRAALVWHAVNVLDDRRQDLVDRQLSTACIKLLKKHPKRTYKQAELK